MEVIKKRTKIKDPRENKLASKTLMDGGTTKERIKEIKKVRPLTAATKIAGDKHFHVNWYHPELKRSFPGNSKLWHVDKYYPYAKDGQLFVDEPRFDYEIQRSKQKSEVLEKIGCRFLILKNGTEPLNEIEGL